MRHSRKEIAEKAQELGFIPHPDEKIEAGDDYIAWRNGEPQLLRCERIRPDCEKWAGWVVAEGNAYSYDFGECVKVTVE